MNELLYPTMAHCAFCECPVDPQEAIWDRKEDLAYCSKEHREEDRLLRLNNGWDYEDQLLSEVSL